MYDGMAFFANYLIQKPSRHILLFLLAFFRYPPLLSAYFSGSSYIIIFDWQPCCRDCAVVSRDQKKAVRRSLGSYQRIQPLGPGHKKYETQMPGVLCSQQDDFIFRDWRICLIGRGHLVSVLRVRVNCRAMDQNSFTYEGWTPVEEVYM